MSLTINSNTYRSPVSQNKNLEHIADKFIGVSVEQLEAGGGKRLTPLSEEEAKKLSSKPIYLHRDLDVFARKDASGLSRNTYVFVDSVMFSAEELESCSGIVNQALGMLPIKGGDLDYHDYAAMGIAANIVNTYADENLSGIQAGVLKKAMNTYMNDYTQAWQEHYQGDNVFRSNDMYYNIRVTPNETERKAVEELMKDASKLPNAAGAGLVQHLSDYLRGGSSTAMAATNQGLIDSVVSLFKNVDLRDDDAVDQAFKTYQQLVAPAYAMRETKGIDNILKVYLSNAKATIDNAGNRVDCSV